jgi:sulfopyruvate decarboxylase subunit beta
MERAGCLEMIYPELEDKLVVTIMGACAQELYNLGHRENFFYLQHAMGLASSIGLGLATHLPRSRVIVLDGDGSVLMNLGTFATLARYRPRNLIHVIFDNGSEHVDAVSTPVDFGEAFVRALERDDLTVIVAKVAAVGPEHYGMDLHLPENAFRFRRHIIEGKRSAGADS